jgi:hypothetical protein
MFFDALFGMIAESSVGKIRPAKSNDEKTFGQVLVKIQVVNSG